MKTQTTQLFRLSVDGHGYAGTLKDVKLPKISQKVESWRGAGMNGEIEVAVGIELDSLDFTLSEVAPGVCKRFGFVQGADKPFTVRKGIKADDGKDVSQRFEVAGMLKEIDDGTTEAGKLLERKFVVSPRSYKEFIDGVEIIHIDLEKGIEKIGGIDRLATARQNAGL